MNENEALVCVMALAMVPVSLFVWFSFLYRKDNDNRGDEP